MATYAGVVVSDTEALRLRGILAVPAPLWRPTDFTRPQAPDEMVRALLWAIGEIVDAPTDGERRHLAGSALSDFDLKHPRGPGGKFRTIADRVLHALQQHIAHPGGKDDPLADFQGPKGREQLRNVAKGRGIDVPRGADIGAIKELLKEHVRGGTASHGAGGSVHLVAIADPSLRPLPSSTAAAPVKKAARKAMPAKSSSAVATPGGGGALGPGSALPSREGGLRKLLTGRPTDVRPLGGGTQGSTDLVTYPGGQKVVRKKYVTEDAQDRADAEVLGARVLDAVGAYAPATLASGSDSVDIEHVDAKTWAEVGDRTKNIPAEILDSDQGRRMGVADILMFNIDRNPGNWFQLSDGRIAGIDHGLAFHNPYAELDLAESAYFFRIEFGQFAVDSQWGRLHDRIDFGGVDLAQVRQRLEALQPEFERVGRIDWFNGMMKRLSELERRAA